MDRAGTGTKPITLANYPGETPVLRAATGAQDNYPLQIGDGAAFFRVRGFIVEKATGSSTTDIYVSGSAHDIEVSHNDIRDSMGQGIFIERTTSHVQIIGNRIHGNGSSTAPVEDHGVYVEGKDQLVANNVIYGQLYGWGIQVYPDADRVIVTSNTVVGNGHGGIVVGGHGSTTVDNTVLVNNIVAFNARAGIRGYYEDGAPGTGNIAYSNLAFSNGVDFVNDPAPTKVIEFARENVSANPLFANSASGDFRLLNRSPAIGRAVAPFSKAVDIDGRRRSRAPSMGAYEFATDRGAQPNS